jgi:hypothetical protein
MGFNLKIVPTLMMWMTSTRKLGEGERARENERVNLKEDTTTRGNPSRVQI